MGAKIDFLGGILFLLYFFIEHSVSIVLGRCLFVVIRVVKYPHSWSLSNIKCCKNGNKALIINVYRRGYPQHIPANENVPE